MSFNALCLNDIYKYLHKNNTTLLATLLRYIHITLSEFRLILSSQISSKLTQQKREEYIYFMLNRKY